MIEVILMDEILYFGCALDLFVSNEFFCTGRNSRILSDVCGVTRLMLGVIGVVVLINDCLAVVLLVAAADVAGFEENLDLSLGDFRPGDERKFAKSALLILKPLDAALLGTTTPGCDAFVMVVVGVVVATSSSYSSL